MYKKILVANDGSPGALRALSAALRLAKQEGAALHMVTVEELPWFPASIDEVEEAPDGSVGVGGRRHARHSRATSSTASDR